MRKIAGAACILLGAAFLLPGAFSRGIFAGEAESAALLHARTIPDALRMPQWGEPPRLPHDLVLGELGRGQAPEAAYHFARSLITALAAGNADAPALAGSPPALIQGHIYEIGIIEPRSFRIGGGRIEIDGNVSFLARFIGGEESITGELFISEESGGWLLDELILEERRSLAEIRDSHRFIFSPYERFF
ncbi:MAG: hypothetical protein FWC65_01695 [Treponema sp.]|nr:hypothetical protein [Treponema sp.]